MKGYIYSMSDSAGNVFYVGSTMTDLHIRISVHKSDCKKSNNKLYSYIRKKAIIPEYNIIEEYVFTDILDLRKREQYWIDEMSRLGFSLKNTNRVGKSGGRIVGEVIDRAVTIKVNKSTIESLNKISLISKMPARDILRRIIIDEYNSL